MSNSCSLSADAPDVTRLGKKPEPVQLRSPQLIRSTKKPVGALERKTYPEEMEHVYFYAM